MFSLQWQNLRKRGQKMPEHVTGEAEAPRPRSAGRDMGVKQDKGRDRNVSQQKFTSPVPEYNGTCWKLGSHLCVQTRWLVKSEKFLFVLSSLTWPPSWKKLDGILISYWFPAFPYCLNCCGSSFSKSFFGYTSQEKLILLQILNAGALEKIYWRCLLNWSSPGFTPLSCTALFLLLLLAHLIHLQPLFPQDLCYLLGTMF